MKNFINKTLLISKKYIAEIIFFIVIICIAPMLFITFGNLIAFGGWFMTLIYATAVYYQHNTIENYKNAISNTFTKVKGCEVIDCEFNTKRNGKD